MLADAPARGDDVTLKDGTPVRVRAIRPDDEPLMAEFHAGLSTRSVYHRYFHITSLEQRITHTRLALTCRTDPALGLALDEGVGAVSALGDRCRASSLHLLRRHIAVAG